MEERQKPSDGEAYDWSGFEEWADANGVGTHTDDWLPSWELWQYAFWRGYRAGEARSG